MIPSVIDMFICINDTAIEIPEDVGPGIEVSQGGGSPKKDGPKL